MVALLGVAAMDGVVCGAAVALLAFGCTTTPLPSSDTDAGAGAGAGADAGVHDAVRGQLPPASYSESSNISETYASANTSYAQVYAIYDGSTGRSTANLPLDSDNYVLDTTA